MTNPPDIADMLDDEIELHIQHCEYLMEECHRQGNPEAALGWKQAIELAKSLRDGGCYFTSMGEKHRIAQTANSA